MPSSSSPRVSSWRQIGLVVGAGLATGALTYLGQSTLPSDWSQAANAISPWLLVAFLVGSTMSDMPRAAIAGIGTLLLALVGYDAMILVSHGYGPALGPTLFWGLGALIGGPVFGVAGRAWRVGSARHRALAVGLLVAVFVAEGIRNAAVFSYPMAGAGFIIAGLLMPLIFGRSRDDRIGAYVAAIPALCLAAIGYLSFEWLNGLTASI